MIYNRIVEQSHISNIQNMLYAGALLNLGKNANQYIKIYVKIALTLSSF